MTLRLNLVVLGLALVLATGARAEAAKNTEDELQKRAEAFVETFNKGDAKALAAFFTADADIVDPEGHHFKGRQAIEEEYRKYFADNKQARLTIHINSIRIARPDLALEDGFTEVITPGGGPPSSARYTAVHVKQDGEWHIESVREAIAVPPTNAQHLQDLAFLVGEWVEDGGSGASRVSYSWTAQGNFLLNTFELTMADIPVAGGTQWIGWDAAAKKPRSWAFLFNGGFAEGVWNRDGDSCWKIAAHATMRDGKKASATNVFTKIDDDHFSFQFVDRTIDGKPLPDDKPVRMRRVR
jgi:uncharacterized protein (TIGR02246 family)